MSKSSNGNSTSSKDNQKEVLLAVDEPAEDTAKLESYWMLGVKKSIKLFAWLAGITLIWLVLYHFRVLSNPILDTGNFIISILLFLLSIPTGLFFRMDIMIERYAAESSAEVALLAALPIVLFNFIIIGAYRGWSKSIKEKNKLRQQQSE